MAITYYVYQNPRTLRQALKRRDRTFSLIISTVGIISILFSVWPYFSWQLTTAKRLSFKAEEAPIPQGQVLSESTNFTQGVQVIKDADGFSYFVTTDQEASQSAETNSVRPKEFYLTIPKLKIEKAKTRIDSLNFYTSLAHFPKTALPGEVGNSFITGHSVLPQFNDPKDYRAIFTKLGDLEVGDDVIATVGDQTYHYVVQYAKIVDPHDLSVLAPISPTGRNLTLMTCVPPGTSTKRLVVITSLLDNI